MKVKVGDKVKLNEPHKGYEYGEIVSAMLPWISIRLSSGLELIAHQDEISVI